VNYDVVIGAGYGDEGKGATTDELCTPDSLVVRFNGGAQAGHTVVRDGIRHVFSHFGSGSLKGAKTYLSKHFVCHPIMFKDELEELSDKGVKPDVYVDPDCYVTTPYDVALNIISERCRNKKHGSVGVGFGETLERCECSPYDLRVKDLRSPEFLKVFLEEIRDEWVSIRLKDIKNWPGKIDDFHQLLTSDRTIERFMDDCAFFMDSVTVTPNFKHLSDHIVFEGAQGLLLDQDYGDFPHVTRSNTGLKNVVDLVGDVEMMVYYVTRAYTTRHGAGPFPHELDEKPYENIVDLTNVPNEHQGTLRFSYLNLDLLIPAIQNDMNYANKIYPQIKITCLDQLPDKAKFIRNGEIHEIPKIELLKLCHTL
jgi:adenylosuccinate synthase